MEKSLTEIRSCTSSVLIFLKIRSSTVSVQSPLENKKKTLLEIVEEMRKSGYNLGGEQSGHVVIMDYNTTGDGQLTGVQWKPSWKPAKEIRCEGTIYPKRISG